MLSMETNESNLLLTYSLHYLQCTRYITCMSINEYFKRPLKVGHAFIILETKRTLSGNTSRSIRIPIIQITVLYDLTFLPTRVCRSVLGGRCGVGVIWRREYPECAARASSHNITAAAASQPSTLVRKASFAWLDATWALSKSIYVYPIVIPP